MLITFSAGEAPTGSPVQRCTTDIMIVDDTDQEPDEIFRVFISDPDDCLGSPAFADVIIQDDDSGMYIYTWVLTTENNSGRIPLTDMLCLHHCFARAGSRNVVHFISGISLTCLLVRTAVY